MPLTDRTVYNFKAKPNAYKVFDGGGLYIHVKPNNTKIWRMAYRFQNKQNTLTFGPYPIVSLKIAREKRDEAKALLLEGIDPAAKKHEEKVAEKEAINNTFEKVARRWHADSSIGQDEKTSKVKLLRLTRNIFQSVGAKPINEVTAHDLRETIRPIVENGKLDYAHRLLQYCGQVFRYAITNGFAEHNVTAELKGAFPSPKVQHRATITDPKKIGPLLRALDGYDGYIPVKYALKLAPLVFLRPGELRGAAWEEFDFNKAEWRIPAGRMKMQEQHIVPLSLQVIEIIKELQQITGHGKLLFPGVRTSDRPISDGTLNAALRRLGYTKDEICAHGFRSMASTLLNELGWNPDAVERQLAHGERNKVRASYNFAEYLPERHRMMQAWSDYLDELKNTP